jgi:hypothetical protein
MPGLSRLLKYLKQVVRSHHMYLSTAIIERAYADAGGCMSEIPEGEAKIPECHNRVYGIKPSSMLSLFVMVLGITCAILMPLVGA